MLHSHSRMSRQRKQVLETLRQMKNHPTADELYDALRRVMPRISLGTVYRNLDVLAEMKLIRRLETAGSQMRFDGDVSDHFHIRCVKCGRIDDISDDSLDGLGDMSCIPPTVCGYTILDYSLHLNGICPACSEGDR